MEYAMGSGMHGRAQSLAPGVCLGIGAVSLSVRVFFAAGIVVAAILFSGAGAFCGPYTDSAHGDTTNGVDRPATDSLGYTPGNCAHCHEQHTSVDGGEPAPAGGTPSEYSLFADNFDTAATSPYAEADSICFTCHSTTGSLMTVVNKNYTETFGGVTRTTAINGIQDAFKALSGRTFSEHNLYDVWAYASGNSVSGAGTKLVFFGDGSNPCVACHNPHRAERNKANKTDPSYSAISRPSDHEALQGDGASEQMDDYATSVSGTYQAPFYSGGASYEPAGTAIQDGSLTPDYNSFCLDCHSNSNVFSTKLNRNMIAIDWGATGDMHGGRPRYILAPVSTAAGAHLVAPYETDVDDGTAGNTNYVLSCLDCHEPHGTVLENVLGPSTRAGQPAFLNPAASSSFLLRQGFNGVSIVGQCGGGGWVESRWQVGLLCNQCHSISGHCGSTCGCLDCHFHGSTVVFGCTANFTNPRAF